MYNGISSNNGVRGKDEHTERGRQTETEKQRQRKKKRKKDRE